MTIYSKFSPPEGFYVYVYLREDGTPYYVGKGRGIRAWTKSKNEVGKPTSNDRISILKANLSENEAFDLEKLTILLYGRKDLNTGLLRNKTAGGDGVSGYKYSTEQCSIRGQAISKAKKGKLFTAEHKLNLSISHRGKPSPLKGTKQSTNIIEAKRLALKGLIYFPICCPHCNKEGAGPVMYRYHFKRCKYFGDK
jgi:hypothetical protein